MDLKKVKNKKKFDPNDEVYEKLKGQKENDELLNIDIEGELQAIEATGTSELESEDTESI